MSIENSTSRCVNACSGVFHFPLKESDETEVFPHLLADEAGSQEEGCRREAAERDGRWYGGSPDVIFFFLFVSLQ